MCYDFDTTYFLSIIDLSDYERENESITRFGCFMDPNNYYRILHWLMIKTRTMSIVTLINGYEDWHLDSGRNISKTDSAYNIDIKILFFCYIHLTSYFLYCTSNVKTSIASIPSCCREIGLPRICMEDSYTLLMRIYSNRVFWLMLSITCNKPK